MSVLELESANMKPNPSQVPYEYLASAITAAAVRTASLRRTFYLSESQAEDIKQTLILELLKREHAFDKTKSGVNTFTGTVSANIAADIANSLSRDRYFMEFLPQCRDADNDSDYCSQTGTKTLGENVVPLWADDKDLFADSDTLHDLGTALNFMSQDLEEIFSLINRHHDLPSAAKASGMSTATFYRRVDELRMHLRMFGIRPAA